MNKFDRLQKESAKSAIIIEQLFAETTEKIQLADKSEHPAFLREILANFQWDEEFIKTYARFSKAPEKYLFQILKETDKLQATMCFWSQNQCTRIHSHYGACGAFLVLSGILIEESFAIAEEAEESEKILVRRSKIKALPEKAIGLIYPDTIHRVCCGGGLAVSLHLYSPPLPDAEQPPYQVVD